MTRAPFINMDAKYLADLAEDFSRDDPAVANRLSLIAERLEGLDEQLLNLTSRPDYERGLHDAYARFYERSNLPEPERAVGPEVANLLKLNTSLIRKIPRGVSGVAPGAALPRKGAKPKAKPVSQFPGLKLDLSRLGVKS